MLSWRSNLVLDDPRRAFLPRHLGARANFGLHLWILCDCARCTNYMSCWGHNWSLSSSRCLAAVSPIVCTPDANRPSTPELGPAQPRGEVLAPIFSVTSIG